MIKNLVIFSSSVCNLNCTYCYVKKEKTLFDYDINFVNALKSNEYINRIKHDFPESPETLKHFEIWGAEPSIHLDIVVEKLKDFKIAFPKLDSFMMSSNFTNPNFIEYVKMLFEAMGEIKDTKWTYVLQCSIDGLEEVNDMNRGIGTTKKIIKNINILKNIEVPENVHLIITNKATISKDSFDDLSNYDFMENYYNFFKSIFSINKNIETHMSAPTCVEPVYYTREDGEKYANVMANFITISKKYNTHYIPYMRNYKQRFIEFECGGLCGQCYSSVIILPNGKYGVCHRTGFDMVTAHYNARAKEVKNDFDRNLISPDNWVVDIEGYKKLVNNMSALYNSRTKLIFTQFYNVAKALRDVGEISPIYNNDELLRKHIKLFMNFTICMQTNKDLTGSYFSCSTYFIPLFFNGAIDKMYKYLVDTGKIKEELKDD